MAPKPEEIVSYTRCSTQKQQVSGLGLEDQAAKVAHYAAYMHAVVVKDFTEQESGKVARRQEAASRDSAGQARRCTLLVSGKLDRSGDGRQTSLPCWMTPN